MPARAVKSKKTAEGTPVEEMAAVEPELTAARVKATTKVDPFIALLKIFSDLQTEFESLQKEISRTRESWSEEQKTHAKEIVDRNIREELERKRNEETYEYETARKRKVAEDEFADKKANWEKQLKDQQEALGKEKAELLELRKVADGFETGKEEAASQARESLQKELTVKFETEKRLREQEIKAEKDILNLRLSNLTADNSRQTAEITVLKKALEEATVQVKEIAVKVIESGTKPRQDLTNDL